MNILLLDNDHAQVAVLQTAFERQGHRVTLHGAVEGAHQVIRETRFDLMIFAQFLPDGSAVPIAFLAQYHCPGIALIALAENAAYGGGELFSMLEGLRCILSKPACCEDLIEIALALDDPRGKLARCGTCRVIDPCLERRGPERCGPERCGPEHCRPEHCDPDQQGIERHGFEQRARAITGAAQPAFGVSAHPFGVH
ncbi:hypothetical protein AQS8620_01235 [Aquimixticola soesokkakensis]|uniref:Response regulatory domain-containing protein n=1 Tax=Aquimixticola soesokkakensis TaxID=1519096 RepID=A0A1Y5S9E3_9RHOB|nr:response regulator [Aquimixticola soesokkakensis]SLN35453.1 hypothetical protein AQS8620_01235 [Aquimixticola soesokkakensis]